MKPTITRCPNNTFNLNYNNTVTNFDTVSALVTFCRENNIEASMPIAEAQ